MKNKVIKILSVFFTLLFLLSAFPLATHAADPGLIEVSGVEADLEAFGIDITKYPKDVTADHCRMLKFFEYGYDYYGGTADYGLYIYLYNPSGKVINVTNGSNTIQMAVLSSAGTQSTDYRKLNLKMVSYSTTQGYENVFYKFRVEDTKSTILPYVEKSIRQYDISGVNVQFMGDNNPTAFKVGGVYSYTGYMPYHAAGRTSESSLQCYIRDRITVDLNLNSVSWKTNTSDKGAGYQYEMFGVYFAVPNDIIRDYGNKDDSTKGLVEVKGTYEEYKVNGLVTSNDDVYNTVSPYIHEYVSDDVPFGFFGGGDYSELTGLYFGCKVYESDRLILAMQQDYDAVDYICCAIPTDDEKFKAISSNEIFDYLYRSGGGNGFYAMGDVDEGRTKGFQYYTVSTSDGMLNSQMSSYASNHSKFVSWLRGESELYDENETYEAIEPIELVSDSDFLKDSIILSDAAIANKLFIQESEVDGLQEFVASSTLKNKTTYLMRFAIRDYYCTDIYYRGDGSAKNYGFGSGNYYFEKTVFHNFDVLSLTYENAYGERTVIPVVCDPINVGGVITPPADGENPNTEPSISVNDVINNVKDMALIWRLLIVVGVFLLVSFVLKLFGISFKDIFRVIGAPFRWARKKLGKLKKRKKKKTKDQKKKQYSSPSASYYQKDEKKKYSSPSAESYKEKTK